MHAGNGLSFAFLLTTALSIPIAFTGAAHAGPPLICHAVPIGDAKSLPWGSDTFTKSTNYDATKAVDDTLDLLAASKSVLFHMETIRRATLYIDKNKSMADQLLGGLMARALDAESAGKPEAMAWFDAGYLAQSYHQNGTPTSFGPGITKGAGASSIEGYAWVARAIAIGGSSAELELAAALMTADSSAPELQEHLKKVFAAGVAAGTPAEDLLKWIATMKGSSLEALRATYGTANARSRG